MFLAWFIAHRALLASKTAGTPAREAHESISTTDAALALFGARLGDELPAVPDDVAPHRFLAAGARPARQVLEGRLGARLGTHLHAAERRPARELERDARAPDDAGAAVQA